MTLIPATDAKIMAQNASNEREKPRYTLITPSIVRSTLLRTCESVDQQTCKDFEHIIIIDIPVPLLTAEQLDRLQKISHKNRTVLFCNRRHMNCGNTCRHNAGKYAKGQYIFYIDDDDYLADSTVLESLNQVTADWAIFPVDVCGRRFYNDPPGTCKTTTGGFLLKNGLIEWPDVPNYETDGMIVDELMRRQVPYQAFPDRVMAVHPVWNRGSYV